MKIDKIKTYLLQVLLIAILLLALFVSNIFTKWVLAIFLGIIAIGLKFYLKKKPILSTKKTQVVWLMVGFGVLFVLLYYALGLYFGFYKAYFPFGLVTIKKFIIPLSIIIISSEVIRKTLLSQEGVKYSSTLTFIIMVLVDLVIYIGAYDVTIYEDALAIVGFILFASIACNLLYNYVGIRFGVLGVILFRLITVLYKYIIPVTPDIYIFFSSFIRMIYPYLVYLILEKTYSKTNFAVAYTKKRTKILEVSILGILMVGLVMLVSCQFRYGIIVVATGSMTGSIDKGDAVIYEAYDDQELEVGQVLIFEREGVITVHRLVDIVSVNGVNRYYTKGDANEFIDAGYSTKDKIKGISKLKVKYIGFPSLWVRSLFD